MGPLEVDEALADDEPPAEEPDAGAPVDVDELLPEDPAIAYVCSPNNPTGLPIPRAVNFLNRCPFDGSNRPQGSWRSLL